MKKILLLELILIIINIILIILIPENSEPLNIFSQFVMDGYSFFISINLFVFTLWFLGIQFLRKKKWILGITLFSLFSILVYFTLNFSFSFWKETESLKQDLLVYKSEDNKSEIIIQKYTVNDSTRFHIIKTKPISNKYYRISENISFNKLEIHDFLTYKDKKIRPCDELKKSIYYDKAYYLVSKCK
ncbi:hypothetical protein [Aureivirga sp. CE67]|uniref:hypothetical protein n=1 Tax=Aureivirga sp. CE67 TaxID=1788983 RepID=UPI0018CB6658|nr:hypothetical protein [Aureivirga sp. CE67]